MQYDDEAVIRLKISELVLRGSPRLDGHDAQHARLLAETGADSLPPILVHRETMRVIDGTHRVLAARLRAEEMISAQFYTGSESDAFVLAVKHNIAHGLPLSSADRKAAVAHIIKSHPHWSDRSIAECTGLSDRTVRTVRHRSAGELPQSDERAAALRAIPRIGRDGRVRPLSGAEGRRRASQILAEQPNATLRAVAEAAGISLGTAHDVRERIRRGEDPVPAGQRAGAARLAGRGPAGGGPAGGGPAGGPPRRRPGSAASRTRGRDLSTAMECLMRDPSLKFTDAGRRLLRWLSSHAIEVRDWESLLAGIPAHCTGVIAEVAQCSAQAWLDLAQTLERHGETAADAAVSRYRPSSAG